MHISLKKLERSPKYADTITVQVILIIFYFMYFYKIFKIMNVHDVKLSFSCVQLFANPMDYSLPGS